MTTTDITHAHRIARLLRRRTFCTLATTSRTHAHGAGVLYQWADGALWVHAMRSSRKARNIAANPNVGVCVPFRRLPFGPPFTLHFQAKAEVVAMDDPAAQRLVVGGHLKKISGHGALDEADGCFLRIVPNSTVHSYGPGVNVVDLARDPLHRGARSVGLDALGEAA